MRPRRPRKVARSVSGGSHQERRRNIPPCVRRDLRDNSRSDLYLIDTEDAVLEINSEYFDFKSITVVRQAEFQLPGQPEIGDSKPQRVTLVVRTDEDGARPSQTLSSYGLARQGPLGNQAAQECEQYSSSE
jgi:hypothetical protein